MIDAMQAERTDEYHELVESTRQFHDELAGERRRGRPTYTELEESDTDLARYQRWLAAIRARDYFDAPGGHEATAAVASCEAALAEFESEALSAELDEDTRDTEPRLRAVKPPDVSIRGRSRAAQLLRDSDSAARPAAASRDPGGSRRRA